MATESEVKLDPPPPNAPQSSLLLDRPTGSTGITPGTGPGLLLSGIPQLLGEAYRSIARPLTRATASVLDYPTGMREQVLPRTYPGPRPGEAGPSLPARAVAGTIIPQTPAQAALIAAGGPLSRLGMGATAGPLTRIPGLAAVERFISKAGPKVGALTGAAERMTASTALGATTSAVTGESPIVGGIEGAGAGAFSEAAGLARSVYRNFMRRYPYKPEGFSRMRDVFAYPISLRRNEHGNWLRSLVDDFDPLRRYIAYKVQNDPNYVFSYGDLLKFEGEVVGSRITRNSKLVQELGNNIYSPLHTALDLMARGVRFDFPFLRRPPWNLAVPDPTMSEILPDIDVDILRRAGSLSANEALKIIQQLKDVAFNPAKQGAVRQAAKDFATQIEDDFSAALGNIHGSLPILYRSAKDEYTQLKGLQYVITKNKSRLFPTGADGDAGLDPVAWTVALRDFQIRMPEDVWPRFTDSVTFHRGVGGGATIYNEPGSHLRLSQDIPFLPRAHWAPFSRTPHVQTPLLPGTPTGRALPTLFPRVLSGAYAAFGEGND